MQKGVVEGGDADGVEEDACPSEHFDSLVPCTVAVYRIILPQVHLGAAVGILKFFAKHVIEELRAQPHIEHKSNNEHSLEDLVELVFRCRNLFLLVQYLGGHKSGVRERTENDWQHH